jgi:hypothetical protein
MSLIDKAFDGLNNFFGNSQTSEFQYVFDNPFSLSMTAQDFSHLKTKLLFSKILKDCFAHASQIPDEFKPLFWDSVVRSYGKSNANDGLITLLANAMTANAELFLSFQKNILRPATEAEKRKIETSIKENRPFEKGLFCISFKTFELTKLLGIFFSFQFLSLNSNYSAMNINKSLQIKIANLRETVSAIDSKPAIKQSKEIARGLSQGKAILLDALDKIETTTVDMSPTKIAIEFLNGLIAESLDMPLSYVNGELQSGLNTNSEGEMTAVERGLLSFYNSIFKPVVDELFGLNVSFVSNNYKLLTAKMSCLESLEVLSDDLMPLDVRQRIVQSLFKEFYSA